MSYDRKIKYLDYLENGDKIRNAGFVKIEKADEICSMQFCVTGLLPTDTIQREVWITDGTKETELGNLQLEHGKGALTLKGLSANGLGKEQIPYDNLYEIYIPISKNREVRCRWGDRKRMLERSEGEMLSKGDVFEPTLMTGRSSAGVREQRTELAQPEGGNKYTADQENRMLETVHSEGGRPLPARQSDYGAAVSDRKPMVSDRNLTGPGRNSTVSDRNMAGPGQNSTVSDRNPMVSERNLTGSGQKSVVSDQKPMVSERKPIGSGQKSVVSDRKPIVSDQKPSVSDRKPTLSDRNSIVSDQGSAGPDQQRHIKTLSGGNSAPTSMETVRGGNRDFMWPQNATLTKKEQQHAHTQGEENVMQARIQEDKWKQLSALYPHMAPFQDDRDFLTIGPNDFVILNRNFHKLVNNSFLLHGYYNYNHLILLRKVKRGTELFYIGVPGNFYEKEKQVALMYGFESFECKKEPAQEGDFGYYMIPVDL
jgi:hypothetical protein